MSTHVPIKFAAETAVQRYPMFKKEGNGDSGSVCEKCGGYYEFEEGECTENLS